MVRQRLDDSASLGLQDIVAGSPQLRTVSGCFRDMLRKNAPRLRSELSAKAVRADLSWLMTEGFARFLGREYQFLDLSRRTMERLERRYRGFVEDVAQALEVQTCEHAVAGAIASHHDRLRDLVCALLRQADALDDVRRGVRPVCAEYSPDLQLEVLGLTPDDFEEPVLDLGCGEEAGLVRHLCEEGIAAWGIDRRVAASERTIRGDWFSVPRLEDGWGTIIAHQSFSLHFLHAHHRSEEGAASYARGYMSLLRALRPGGQLVYAPGLPFIESVLPADRFQVVRRPVAASRFVSLRPPAESQPAVAVATKVTRLP